MTKSEENDSLVRQLRNEVLEIENDNLQEENGILQSENADLRNEKADLRNEINCLQNEILALKGEPKKKPSPLSKIGEATVSQKVLGSGGFGIVYEGLLDGRVVAVKRQKLEENTKKQIQREIEVLCHFEHKNICRYYRSQTKTIDGVEHLDIFMKKYDLDLKQLILNETNLKAPSTVEKRKLLKEIVDGIMYLHSSHPKKEKIIHRDLKPENILILIENGSYSCALSDFGFSKIAKTGGNSMANTTNSYHGTLAYSAPETLSNSGGKFHKASEKSDIYSLGLVIYFVLTDGQHPFGNDLTKTLQGKEPTLEAVRDSVFKQLLETMLKQDRNERISVDGIVVHPAFFDEAEKLDYIEKCYEILKNANEKTIQLMDYEFDKLDWREDICPNLRKENLGHIRRGRFVDQYQRTFLDLVKAIRNKSAHFNEFCRDLSNSETATVFSGSSLNKELFCNYWINKFPQIIPILYTFLALSFPSSAEESNFLFEFYGNQENLEIIKRYCYKAYSCPEIQTITKEETSAVVQNLKENKICVMSASSSHEKPWKLSFKLKLKQSCKVFNEIEKEEKVSAFDFRCADCQVAIGYESGLTWIYDSEGREIHNLKGSDKQGESSHTEKVLTVRWSPDGILVASGGKDGRICVWDRKNGKYGVIRCSQIDVEGYAKDIYWCSETEFIISVGHFTILKIIVESNQNVDRINLRYQKVDLRSTDPSSICPIADEFSYKLSDKADKTSLEPWSGVLTTLSQTGKIYVWSLPSEIDQSYHIHATLPPPETWCNSQSKNQKQAIRCVFSPSSKIIYLASVSNICLRVWRFQLDDNCNFQVKKFPPENLILTFTAPDSCSIISAFSFSPCVRFFVYAQNFSVSIFFLKAASLQPFKLFSSPEKMRIDGFEWHSSSTKLYFWGKNGSYLIDLSAVAEFRDAHMSTF